MSYVHANNGDKNNIVKQLPDEQKQIVNYPFYDQISGLQPRNNSNVNLNNSNVNLNSSNTYDNQGYVFNSNTIPIHFQLQPGKHFFLELLRNSTFSDVKRIFEITGDIFVDHFYCNQEPIPFSLTIDQFEQKYHSQTVDFTTKTSHFLSQPNSRQSSQLNYNSNSELELNDNNQQGGGFAFTQRVPLGVIIGPSPAPQQIKKQKMSKKKKISKIILNNYDSKIIEQVQDILIDPNDTKELLRRLDGLKSISKLNNQKKSFNVEKAIRAIRENLSSEQLNLCKHLSSIFHVGLHTAIQIFILEGYNEYKAQLILRSIPPEECCE